MAFLLEIIRLGLNNLRLHKLRSFLTSLGIILGVGAVIVMISIGKGTEAAALREIDALGATNIIVRSVRPPESSSVGDEARSSVAKFGIGRTDLRRIASSLPDASEIVPLKAVGDEISYQAQRTVSQSFGTTPDLLGVARLRIARGRYLADSDMDLRKSICVIGHQVEEQFFPLEDPIGREIRIGQQLFRIVGVLEPVGLAGGTGSALVGRDLNQDVHIPLTTAELLFGDIIQRRLSGSFVSEEIEVSEIYVSAPTTLDVVRMARRVERIVDVDHADTADVQVIVPYELLEQRKRTQRIWNIVLISIASISLLIGGIGIMNIMLATVTERTREIGIRRALGATRQHITLQFLVETGTLACVGGLIGIGVGVGLSVGIEYASSLTPRLDMETQVTTWSIVASFLVSAFVGLVFGLYPAIQASRKDPIVALRHD
ncbi:MAG: ABC transporter permease [Phycisphaerales bacterium]